MIRPNVRCSSPGTGVTWLSVVSLADYAQVERLRSAGPEGGLASLAGGWKGSEELADELQRIPRTAGR